MAVVLGAWLLNVHRLLKRWPHMAIRLADFPPILILAVRPATTAASTILAIESRKRLSLVCAGQPDLYDLRADPAEKQNVSSLYPQQVSRFQASVDTHLRRVAETEPGMAVPKLELDEEVVMRLRDLGYME